MTRLRDLPKPGEYARLWRAAYAAADAGQKVSLYWAGPDLDSDGVRRAFRLALDKRINARASTVPTGRHDSRRDPSRYTSDEAYWRLRRDQRRVQDKLQRRIAVHQFETPLARRRFGHLLSERGDY